MGSQARSGEPEDLTEELAHLVRGGAGARSSAVDFLQRELRVIARSYLRSDRGQVPPTELVQAAYLRLFERSSLGVRDRKHFFALAARAMRQILVDQYRRGREAPIELDSKIMIGAPESTEDALDLNELDRALVELAKLDERQSRIVELRYFAGLDVASVADVLEVSKSTVERDWRFARAWLSARLDGTSPR